MRIKTVSAAMLSLLCVPVVARANDWKELRSDGSGSRASTEASGTSFGPAWTYTAKHGGKLLATPVSVDGLVIAAGTNGDLSAVGLENGQERWAQVIDGGIGSTPAVLNGRLVTSSLNGQLYGLDLQSGAISWQRPFGGNMNYASPTIVKDDDGGPGSVVLPSAIPTHDVSRIDLATGVSAWCTPGGAIADLLYTTPAVVGQQAIVGMNGGRYQSLDLQSGATRWTFDATGPVNFSSPLVVGDTVYMFPGDAKSQLFAAKVDNGQPVSGFPLAIPDPAPVPSNGMLGRGPATSPPMTAGGLIIFQMRRQDMQNGAGGTFKVAMREYVVAVDPKLLKIVWQHAVGNVVAPNVNGVPELNTCPTPVAFAGPSGPVIAVSSSIAAKVAILDVATGEERWSAALSGPGRSSPVFSNGLLLVGTDAGVLHAFSSSVNRAPSTPSGLVVGHDDGNLTLGWDAASDPEGQPLTYVVRVLEDGAAATTTETETLPGQTTLTIVPKANTTYHVSVRARDGKGALSAPSACQLFHNGEPAPGPVVGSSDGPPSMMMVPPPSDGVAMSPPPPPSGDVAMPPPPFGDPAPAEPATISTTFTAPTTTTTTATATATTTATAETATTETATTETATKSAAAETTPATIDQAGGCSVAGHGGGGASGGAFALALLAFAAHRSRKRASFRG
jgi:MYXO-CTERM domain-containing protein